MDRAARRRRQEVRRVRDGASRAGRVGRLRRAAAREGDRGARPRRLSAALQRRRQSDHRDRRRTIMSAYRRAHPARHRQRRAADHRQADRARTAAQRGIVRGGDLGRRQPTRTRSIRVRRRRQADVQQLTHQNDALFAELQLGDDRRGQRQEQGRHRGPRPADDAARLRRGHEDPDAAADPRRPERPGSAQLRVRAAVVRGQRLRGARGQLSRQRRARREVLALDLGRLGPLRSGRPAGDGRSGRQDGRRRSRTSSASAAGATAASSPTT